MSVLVLLRGEMGLVFERIVGALWVENGSIVVLFPPFDVH